MTDGPLIVQSDKTLLLEVDHPLAEAARRAIAPFAELERAPEHVHTYRVTPLGLWNARAAGHDAEQVVDALLTYSRYAVPQALLIDVADTMSRYGRLTLDKHPTHGLVLHTTDRPVLEEVLRHKRIRPLVGERIDESAVAVPPSQRGYLKQELVRVGWPAEDLAGYVDGEAHPIELDETGWALRPYQRQAVDGFWHGGSGVVVLPCGAGKTLVGAGAMATAQATTLILVTSTVAARQWKDELLRRTSLTDEEIGEYSGSRKEVRPVTIATYQVLTTRRKGVYTAPGAARCSGLGAHRLRRGPPAAGARVPAHGRPAGPSAPRASPRPSCARTAARATCSRSSAPSASTPHGRTSRPRAGSPRPTAARCGSRSPRPSGCGMPSPSRTSVTASRPAPPPRTASSSGSSHGIPANRRWSSASTSTSSPRWPSAWMRRSSPARRGWPNGSGCTAPSATASLPCSSSARSRTSPSTCPRRPWRSRCRARSGRGRRRPSGWAGSCGRRPTGAPRTSTASSRATPWTPTSPLTGSGSSPSRATPTASSLVPHRRR